MFLTDPRGDYRGGLPYSAAEGLRQTIKTRSKTIKTCPYRAITLPIYRAIELQTGEDSTFPAAELQIRVCAGHVGY